MAISERLLTPGQEGSEQALQILQLLHQTTPAGGVSITDICGHLAMTQPVAKAALKGLYSRGRVCTDGHGMGARWVIKDREST